MFGKSRGVNIKLLLSIKFRYKLSSFLWFSSLNKNSIFSTPPTQFGWIAVKRKFLLGPFFYSDTEHFIYFLDRDINCRPLATFYKYSTHPFFCRTNEWLAFGLDIPIGNAILQPSPFRCFTSFVGSYAAPLELKASSTCLLPNHYSHWLTCPPLLISWQLKRTLTSPPRLDWGWGK